MLLIQSFENKSNFIIHTQKKTVEILFKKILVSFYSSIGYIFFICSLRFCKSEMFQLLYDHCI